MFIELHILQNFAPSNLNRDDTGAPKDCEFGGFRRARISSQCLKRAVRTTFKDAHLLPIEQTGARTKRVVEELARRLGKNEDEAAPAIRALFESVKLNFDKDGKSQYLLYLGETEIDRLTTLCKSHWETLSTATASQPAPTAAGRGSARTSARDTKRAGAASVPSEIATAVRNILDGGKAADVALFGRMLADLPDRNVDAACQVAHALSTHQVNVEFDFYTAVDDLKPEDTAGADMLGTIEFNSACFYRYANIDLTQLQHNLQGDAGMAHQALDALLRASVDAIPTGKQNSMAAQNKPSFVLAVVRERGLWSLSNAFLKPVRPSATTDLMEGSIAAMSVYWSQLRRVYGDDGIIGAWSVALSDGRAFEGVQDAQRLDTLYASVRAAVGTGVVTVGVSA